MIIFLSFSCICASSFDPFGSSPFGSSSNNLHLNVFLNAVAEMPAFLMTALLLDKFGWKPLSIGMQWFSGCFCVIGGLMHVYGSWKTIRMLCGILGIFRMAGTYNLLFIYTVELFPTVVRNAALGCAAQMGAILAPFVVVLGERILFLVFGVCGILGGTLAFLLPETLNRPLLIRWEEWRREKVAPLCF